MEHFEALYFSCGEMTKMLAGALAYLARTKVKNLVCSLFSKGFERDGGVGEGKTFVKKFSLPPQKDISLHNIYLGDAVVGKERDGVSVKPLAANGNGDRGRAGEMQGCEDTSFGLRGGYGLAR